MNGLIGQQIFKSFSFASETKREDTKPQVTEN